MAPVEYPGLLSAEYEGDTEGCRGVLPEALAADVGGLSVSAAVAARGKLGCGGRVNGGSTVRAWGRRDASDDGVAVEGEDCVAAMAATEKSFGFSQRSQS